MLHAGGRSHRRPQRASICVSGGRSYGFAHWITYGIPAPDEFAHRFTASDGITHGLAYRSAPAESDRRTPNV